MKMLAAATNERVFDLGKIIEVIQIWSLESGVWSRGCTLSGLVTLDSRLPTLFVNQSQSFQRQRVINQFDQL